MTLYQRVKKIAIERGIAIGDMERDLGFGQGTLSRIDRHSPSVSKLQKIAEYLHVPVSAFLEDPPERKYYFDDESAEIAQEIHDNRDMLYLFDAMKRANPDTLKALVATLEGMKKKEQYDGEDPC